MTQHEGVYELLNSRGERVGTAYVEHGGPLSRWSWFAHVNGETASNAGSKRASRLMKSLRHCEEIWFFPGTADTGRRKRPGTYRMSSRAFSKDPPCAAA